MKTNIAIIISFLSILISITSIVYAVNVQYEVNDKYSNLNSEISNINYKILNVNNITLKNSEEINKNYKQIKNLENLFNITITSQQTEIQNLTSDLEKYNSELSNKLSWIKANSNIENFSEYSEERNLLNKCVGSEINLGCVWHVIYDDLNIKYINDSTFHTNDTLFNLSEIYNHGGGDCEDLSLLFSASVRYLINKYDINEFNSWVPGNGKYEIYSTSDKIYYLLDANEKHFSAKYVYVTCFATNETIGIHNIGHCIVSFCNKKVDSYMDLYNCTEIEPQDGGITSIGPIWLYISSNNLCMPIDNKTKCFTDFKNNIEDVLH